jgi:hypothetical protein
MDKARAVNFKPGRKTAWSLRPCKARTSQMLCPGRGDANGALALKDELMMRLKRIGEFKELRQLGDDD